MSRRNPYFPVGMGDIQIPYDQSGGFMPQGGGMQVPEPGGSMKKMQFEFADPAEQQMQAAQAQMQGAGIPPAGAGGGQGAPPDQGMGMPQEMPPMQGMPQGGQGSIFGAMAPQAGGMPQGGMSDMLGNEDLAGMLESGDMGMGMDGGINPIDLQADQMEQQLANDPELQMKMMMAARRMGGF